MQDGRTSPLRTMNKKTDFDIFSDLFNYLNNPEQIIIFLDTITWIFIYLKPFLNQTIREYENTQIHLAVLEALFNSLELTREPSV